jgi:beta-galactosidase
MDVFRQPKYAYFMLQNKVKSANPTLFLAHEITPFSSPDVAIYTSCDSVRLIVCGYDTLLQAVSHAPCGIPKQPAVFKNAYNFDQLRKKIHLQKEPHDIFLIAEGIRDGRVVVRERKVYAYREAKLQLRLDNEDQPLIADGADFMPVIAEITDDSGSVCRLAKENVLFSVEGEGQILGDHTIGANPRAVEFGTAPVLVRSTLRPGRIKLTARVLFEGEHTPKPVSIEWESVVPNRLSLNEEE